MGFTADTAAIVDADLLKYAYEQQIANLQRGGNTFATLYQGATNELIRRLRARGYSTTQISGITNVEDFRPALVYWCLACIFRNAGGSRNERETALSKASDYEQRFERHMRETVAVLSDASVRQTRGLPIVVNVDGGSMFPALGSARPTQVGRNEIDGYEDLVIEGQ